MEIMIEHYSEVRHYRFNGGPGFILILLCGFICSGQIGAAPETSEGYNE